MKKDIITEKSIRELVEAVQEGKVHEVVIENEIEKTKYIINKSDSVNGVNIYIVPITKPVKAPKYVEWEGQPDVYLDKALDYMKEPFPKVTKEVLDSYKLFLEAELKRLTAISEVYTINSNNNHKILETMEGLRNSNELEMQKIKTGRIDVQRQHIWKKIRTIEQFLASDK